MNDVVFFFTPRTGTQLISSLYKQNNKPILREFFNMAYNEYIKGFGYTSYRESKADTDYEYVNWIRENYNPIYCKIQARDLSRFTNFLNILKEPKFFLITRNDKVRQAISVYKAIYLKYFQAATPPKDIDIPYDSEKILNALKNIIKVENQNKNFLQDKKHDIIVYEELVNNLPACLEKLGLPTNSKPATFKQANENSEFLYRKFNEKFSF